MSIGLNTNTGRHWGENNHPRSTSGIGMPAWIKQHWTFWGSKIFGVDWKQINDKLMKHDKHVLQYFSNIYWRITNPIPVMLPFWRYKNLQKPCSNTPIWPRNMSIMYIMSIIYRCNRSKNSPKIRQEICLGQKLEIISIQWLPNGSRFC